MMLKSKPVKAEEALRLGLVDAVFPADQLIAAATQLAKDIADKKIPRKMALRDRAKLPADEATAKKTFAGARRQAKRVKHLMPHPWLCLDAVETGVAKGSVAGLATEQDAFAKAVSSLACKGLVHFFSRRAPPPPFPGSRTRGSSPGSRSASRSWAEG